MVTRPFYNLILLLSEPNNLKLQAMVIGRQGALENQCAFHCEKERWIWRLCRASFVFRNAYPALYFYGGDKLTVYFYNF